LTRDLPASERLPDGVIPVCDGPAMNDLRLLKGIELRYVLTHQLFTHGPAAIADLVEALAFQGFGIASPAPKSVSDALRWESGRGRVRRLGRGRYGPGWMPRGTEHRIHTRVQALRDEAPNRSEAGKSHPDIRDD
jgi:hypothetical protein